MSDDQPPSSTDPAPSAWSRFLDRFRSGPRDRRHLKSMLGEARDRGVIRQRELNMVEGVLDVSEMQVRDVMIPRSQMVVIERDMKPDQLLEIIIESGHSRFPVIGDDRDEVVGILLAKDVLRFFADREGERFDIRECLRPAVFIPESKRLNTLLEEFRLSHNHMAIVVDEYGGVAGLLTIEDVLEEIVGEIDDEHDEEEAAYIRRESEDTWAVRALTRIDDFNETFGVEFSDEHYDTVGGMVMHELGRLPRRGETLERDGFKFTVTRADRRRIETLRVRAGGHRQQPDTDAA